VDEQGEKILIYRNFGEHVDLLGLHKKKEAAMIVEKPIVIKKEDVMEEVSESNFIERYSDDSGDVNTSDLLTIDAANINKNNMFSKLLRNDAEFLNLLKQRKALFTQNEQLIAAQKDVALKKVLKKMTEDISGEKLTEAQYDAVIAT
jgi:hypothetical protein